MRSNYDENEKEVEEEPNCKIFVASYWKLAVSVLKDIIKSSETVILTHNFICEHESFDKK